MADLALRVVQVIAQTPEVRAIVLENTSGTLPAFEPGAHVCVQVPGNEMRHYSLVDLRDYRDSGRWVLGVRLEEESRGGSRFMHGLAEGDEIVVSQPKNDFPLVACDAPIVLFAGGIGITPILSMAARLADQGRPFTLHYCGRSRGKLAFVPDLERICGERLVVHFDDEPDRALDIKSVLARHEAQEHVYVCGPAGMIEAVKAAAAARGFAKDHIHFELFSPAKAAGVDESFDIELRASGQTLTVPPGKSIIDVMLEAGLDPLFDCRRGDCGICQTAVIEGIPDHRDVILSEGEKASNKLMQICVSRAKSKKLVLDL